MKLTFILTAKDITASFVLNQTLRPSGRCAAREHGVGLQRGR